MTAPLIDVSASPGPQSKNPFLDLPAVDPSTQKVSRDIEDLLEGWFKWQRCAKRLEGAEETFFLV
jgi:hypothetical protein